VIEIVLAFAVAALIAFLAWKAKALSESGAIAACALGGITVAGGGWNWGVLLVVFFVTSSGLSKLADRAKPDHGKIAARGSRRDAVQVLANGGLPLAFALINWISPHSIWYAGFAAALAAAAADTWATEIGSWSRRAPRMITTLRPVEAGMSGAISLPGTLGSAAGALLIGVLAGSVAPDGLSPVVWLVLAVAIGGLSGSLIDSLLGATVQAIYRCPACGSLVESPMHRCGTATLLVRGHRFMNNDVVNFSAITAGSLITMLLWQIV
jgi:uncharacterized protein (TIGR00297 family)